MVCRRIVFYSSLSHHDLPNIFFEAQDIRPLVKKESEIPVYDPVYQGPIRRKRKNRVEHKLSFHVQSQQSVRHPFAGGLCPHFCASSRSPAPVQVAAIRVGNPSLGKHPDRPEEYSCLYK